MSKHKCGTCRFYQEARLASSGWCHHPQRKTTSDLMIMVRKNELACRDEWSHDLWEPRTEAGSLAAGPPAVDHFPDRKMPPATELDIAALVKSGAAPPVATPERELVTDDVVLSELGTSSEPVKHFERPDPVGSRTMPEGRPVDQASPSPALNSGTRSAIIKAREAFRERSRHEAARLTEIARLASQAGSAAAGEPANASRLDAVQMPDRSTIDRELTGVTDPASPPVSAGQAHLDATSQEPADRALDETAAQSHRHAEDDAAPPADGVPLPDPVLADHRLPVVSDVRAEGPSTTESSAHRFRDEDVSNVDRRSRPQPDLPDASNRDASRSFDSADVDWFAEQPATRPSSCGQSVNEDPAFESISFEERNAANFSNDVEHDNINSTDQERLASSDWQDDTLGLDANAATADQIEADASWLETDVVADDELGTEDQDQLVESALSAHLPRICQTCRDFRPAEAGNRGWCANQWAFTHRRMVDAGDHIPCDGILGHWWVPVDEVWSEAADVSSHGQPTPLLDAWLPQHRDDVPARRRS